MGLQQITGNEIAAGSIAATDLASASITGDKLGATSINANNIVGGTITTTQIASNTISNTNIQTGAIENYSRATGLLSGMRNRIINGAMVIDQRNAGASVTATTSGPYTLDRWYAQATVNSKYTVQQNAGAVTPPVGFSNYLGATSSAATVLAAGDYYCISQGIEGFNIADLAWGTANAKTVTLSFQVYSSQIGTFGGSLWTGNSGAYVPFSYSIPTANTWTNISVTIAGPTIGSWYTNNSNGVTLNFSLGAGTTYSGGTAGTWSSTLYIQPSGCVNIVTFSGATFYITGVQLEVGSTATSFDYRSIGTELNLCYRYYYQLGGDTAYQSINTVAWYTTADAVGYFSYPVTMRIPPNISKTGTWVTLGGGGTVGQTVSADQLGNKTVQLGFGAGSGGTTGQASTLRANNDTSLRVTFNAEL